jgi:hypothetical protein
MIFLKKVKNLKEDNRNGYAQFLVPTAPEDNHDVWSSDRKDVPPSPFVHPDVNIAHNILLLSQMFHVRQCTVVIVTNLAYPFGDIYIKSNATMITWAKHWIKWLGWTVSSRGRTSHKRQYQTQIYYARINTKNAETNHSGEHARPARLATPPQRPP